MKSKRFISAVTFYHVPEVMKCWNDGISTIPPFFAWGG
jgi:hypothetical protein